MGIFECEICDEEYSNVDEGHVPKVLKCGHSICQNCTVKLARGLLISCPFCREVTKVVEGNVKNLNKNFELIRAIEKMKLTSNKDETSSNSPPKCTAHPYNLAEFVCKKSDCSAVNELMCRTCEEFGIHKGHEKGLLILEAAKLRKTLECRVKQMELNYHHLLRETREIEGSATNNEQLLNQELKKIKTHFLRQRQAVNDIENIMINHITAHSTSILEFNRKTTDNLASRRKKLVENTKITKQFIDMNDFDLYVAGIDLGTPEWCYNPIAKKHPPAGTEGMIAKLPTIKLEYGD